MSPLIKTWAHGSCSWPVYDRSGGWSFGVLESDREGKLILTVGQGHVKVASRAKMELKSIEMLLKYVFKLYGSNVYLIVFTRSRRGISWATRRWKCRTHMEICDEIRRTIQKIGRNNVVFRHVWGNLASTEDGRYIPLAHEDTERMDLIYESANRARMNLLGKLVTEEELVFLDSTGQTRKDSEAQQ